MKLSLLILYTIASFSGVMAANLFSVIILAHNPIIPITTPKPIIIKECYELTIPHSTVYHRTSCSKYARKEAID